MTKDEWQGGPRFLLLTGWPKAAEAEFDDNAYTFLLERFSVEDVNEAIRALIGRSKYLPKAGEIATSILAARPAISIPVPATVSEQTLARRAWMDERDRQETDRRDADLDEWWDHEATPQAKTAGERWLAEHGYAPIREETF